MQGQSNAATHTHTHTHTQNRYQEWDIAAQFAENLESTFVFDSAISLGPANEININSMSCVLTDQGYEVICSAGMLGWDSTLNSEYWDVQCYIFNLTDNYTTPSFVTILANLRYSPVYTGRELGL